MKKLAAEKSPSCVFSTGSTFCWMEREWERHIKPRFDRFLSVLEARESIPERYLSSQNASETGCNHTLKFLRPRTICSIVENIREALANGDEGNRSVECIVSRVIVPFVGRWQNLFDRLEVYYGDAMLVAPLRDKFRSLCLASRVLQGSKERFTELVLKGSQQGIFVDTHTLELLEAEFRNELIRLPRTAGGMTALTATVARAAREGAASSHKSVITLAKKIAEASFVEYDRKSEDDADERALDERRGRKKLGGEAAKVVEFMLVEWRSRKASSSLTPHGFVQQFYGKKKIWVEHGWMTADGKRKCWPRKPGEIDDGGAILRLYAKFSRELKSIKP